jgi:hypothetical protein
VIETPTVDNSNTSSFGGRHGTMSDQDRRHNQSIDDAAEKKAREATKRSDEKLFRKNQEKSAKRLMDQGIFKKDGIPNDLFVNNDSDRKIWKDSRR